MSLLAELRRSGGFDAIARQTAMPPPDAAAAAQALLPGLVAAIRARLRAPGGFDDLLALLETRGGGQLALDVLAPRQVNPRRGQRLLADLFASGVAEPGAMAGRIEHDAAAEAGLTPKVVAAVLPVLAMLIGGYLAARAEAGDDRAMLEREFTRLLN